MGRRGMKGFMMFYYLFGTPQSILDTKMASIFDFNSRQNVPIALIDDQDFPSYELLSTHGYRITCFKDVEDVHVLESYAIILCDIKGVGKAFQSKFEGAHLISEIRKCYPHKVIIAYTSYQHDPTYNKYFAKADSVVKKDIDIDEWIEELDRAIKLVANPVFLWTRIRNKLLELELPIAQVMDLEDQFVSYVRQKKTKFPNSKLSSSLPDRILPILKGLAKTVKLLKS